MNENYLHSQEIGKDLSIIFILTGRCPKLDTNVGRVEYTRNRYSNSLAKVDNIFEITYGIDHQIIIVELNIIFVRIYSIVFNL